MSEGLGRGWVVGRVKGGPTATAEAPGTAPALSCCGGSSGHKAKALENTITLPLPTQGEPLRDYKDHSRKDTCSPFMSAKYLPSALPTKEAFTQGEGG